MDIAVKPARLQSVDMLRGAIMIIMALDHVREYVHFLIEPVDMQHTWPMLFFTRWITHFCAPLFMFLAGTGAFLSLGRGKSKRDLARFLFTRGVFLIAAEQTIMQVGWTFRFQLLPFHVAILGALGLAMVALSGLIFLPPSLIIGLSAAMVLLHNAFDNFHAASWGDMRWIWGLLHEGGAFGPPTAPLLTVDYPLIPWIGVMALGYAFGSVLKMEASKRHRTLYFIGGFLTLVFFVLRWANVYGDPHPWQVYPTASLTVISFFRCAKYPPSLLFLLMTIGPGIAVLPLLERVKNRVGEWIIVYGRVPMFYYILHVYLVHAIAMGLAAAGHRAIPRIPSFMLDQVPANWGFPLWVVYVVWMVVVVALYPVCRWYAELKKRRNDWWLGYI
jgi:uncharacterized membrane protein